MEDYELHTLPNGIRIVHKQVPHTQIAHCGIMLDIGSRDELPQQEGLAHFWEHMAFKGTQKRKSFHIINRLETVGGELNAYTTKEKVCFHASVLGLHFEKATELLADIAFYSVFPEKQIEKERSVILEEMAMYYDSPEDALQDDFDQVVFKNHPLGGNILGRPETVRAFTREQLQQFIAGNLDTERVVFASVSNWSFSKVKKIATKYLSDIPHRTSDRKRLAPGPYEPQRLTVERPITQAQCAIGRPSYALPDARRLPFFMLVNLLGGPGMNSRLNMNLREKYGLVYSIEASYTPFLDTGFLGIYFGTDQKHLDRSIALIGREMKLLREKPLTTLQLHHTKEQLMGQLAMSEESNQSLMLTMAKSILDTSKLDSLEEIFAEIRQVDAGLLQELAHEMFDEPSLSHLIFVPEPDEDE
ncbi:M16 family metallopeptidase [Larkinella sp. VNQ87]|uniref:M16 family metallopeptidase n=1 Tax=Larkinella sp. VNQ87 TaxID=3400921 RepID=UPI003C03A467